MIPPWTERSKFSIESKKGSLPAPAGARDTKPKYQYAIYCCPFKTLLSSKRKDLESGFFYQYDIAVIFPEHEVKKLRKPGILSGRINPFVLLITGDDKQTIPLDR